MLRECGQAVLRVAIGAIFVAHALPKLWPAWGATQSTTALLEAGGLARGSGMMLATGAVEAAGGIALIAGAYTFWVGLGLLVETIVIVWKLPLASTLFLNWTQESGVSHGYEYHVLLASGLVALMLGGAGALSFDAYRARSAEALALGRARLRSGKVP